MTMCDKDKDIKQEDVQASYKVEVSTLVRFCGYDVKITILSDDTNIAGLLRALVRVLLAISAKPV